MDAHIYKITNKINGKSYIGVTSNPTKRRWEHLTGRGSNLVANAVKKYGEDAFTFTVLESYDSAEAAFANEQDYIELYDTKNNGYNLADGGCGGRVMDDYSLRDNTSYRTLEYRQRTSDSLKRDYADGRRSKPIMTSDRKKHLSDLAKQDYANGKRKKLFGSDNPMFGKKHSDEHRQRVSDKLKQTRAEEPELWPEYKHSAEIKDQMKKDRANRVHINRNGERKFINQQDLQTYLDEGWERGRGKLKTSG